LLPGHEQEEAMMTTEEPRVDTVAEHLQDLVLGCADVEDLLTELAVFSAMSLSVQHRLLASVTLLRHKKATTVACSDPKAIALDEMQYGFGDGPCLTAIRDMDIVHIPDPSHETRWPAYSATVQDQGIGSILSVPMPLEGEANAGLNLYSTDPHAFTGEDIEEAEAYSGQASKALRLAVRIAQLTDTRNNMTAAMQSRTTINLAAGAIMAQNRCTQEAAMKILKIASSSRNVKLRDVAASVVASISQDPAVLTHFDE
jgi:GAF domain-containing protein